MKKGNYPKLFKQVTTLLGIIALGITSNEVVAQEVITVQQAIEKTLENNLQVKNAKLNERLAEVNFEQSKFALYPSLNFGNNNSMNWGRNQSASGLFENTQRFSMSANLSSGVDLFNGFSKINQIKQNKTLVSASETSTDKVKNDLILQVFTSYLQILFNKDLLVAAQDQLKVAQAQFNQQDILMQEGNKTLADVSQAKSQVATAELNVTNAQNNLAISYLTLAQLMDIPSSTVYEVQVPNIADFSYNQGNLNPEEIFNSALNTFPDIKLAQLNTEASRIGISVAKGNMMPRISMNGSFGSSYFYSYHANIPNATFAEQFKNNQGKGVGISLQIPIFNGLQARSSVTRARINLMQNETQEQLAKNNLNKVIYQAIADLKAAEARFESTTKAFLAQKDAFFAISERYNVGLVNSVEFNTSQTNRNKAELDMIQAKYDLLFRAKVIDYYLGKPINF
ncbi:MAG: TolC family protein [Pedobacter sp.]|nr:MAG: TolC family protein [Pedobacter sp.]